MPVGDVEAIKSVADAQAVKSTLDSLGLVETDPDIVSLLDCDGENDVLMLAESESLEKGDVVVDTVVVTVTIALNVIVKLIVG